MSKQVTDGKEPLNTITKGLVDGTGAFLGRICLPAAEEFGLLLQDKVKAWRNKNFVKISKNAEKLISNKSSKESPLIHPRILHSIYENGSWTEDEELQNMWAGLLTSSCYDEGTDQGIFYVDILSKMSQKEAVLFNYVCNSSEWRTSLSENLVEALAVFTDPSILKSITKMSNFEDIDESISHLQLLGLLSSESGSIYGKTEHYDSIESESFEWESSGSDGQWYNSVELRLTSLGIRLFLKVQGIEKRPSEHFKDKIPRAENYEEFDY